MFPLCRNEAEAGKVFDIKNKIALILVQIFLIFTLMISHLVLFLKGGHLELRNSLFTASAISEPNLGFSDFSCAVSAFSQVFILTHVSH